MRCLRDAQHDTITDRRDFDVKHSNGWRSLPIVESWVFVRCAVLVRRVRCCAVLCGAVRSCAVFCIQTTSKQTTSVELANDVGAPCKHTPLLTFSAT